MITLPPILPYLLLAAAVVAAFGNAVRAPFHYDDFAIFAHPAIASAEGWRWLLRLDQERQLTWFSFWLNHRLAGDLPWSWHAVNLVLHAASSFLLFDVARRLIPRRAAWIAGFLFALHPIQTEAVVYVWARGTLLATLLCLLSFRYWLVGRHWTAAAWFAAAVFAKEECAAFPLFLALFHLSVSRNRREWPPIAAMVAIALAAVVRVAILTVVVPGSGAGPQAGISAPAYFLTQGWSILRYLLMLVIPAGFSIDPDIPILADWRGAACWLAIAVLAWASTHAFDRARSGFWFLGGIVLLLPTSSIFPAADLAADRRMYLPMASLIIAAGMLLERTSVPVLLGAGGVVCTMLSYARTDVWLTPQGLWEDAIRQAPARIRPRVQLSRRLPVQDALRHLEEAKSIAPDDPEIASETGRRYLELGKPSEALAEFGRAVALDPNNAAALNNRGVALLLLGIREHAVNDFSRAIERSPCLFDAHLNLKKTGHAVARPGGCRWTDEQIKKLQESP